MEHAFYVHALQYIDPVANFWLSISSRGCKKKEEIRAVANRFHWKNFNLGTKINEFKMRRKGQS